jgi:hypothetical protein
MTTAISRQTLCRGVMARAVATVAVLLGLASPAFAQARGLEGVWGVVTQDRNCTTNAAQGSPTRALITYHTDGTVSESRHIPVFALGQLSESHGIWKDDGRGNYQGRVVTMINFASAAGTTPSFQPGWMLATQTITLVGPNTFTMTGSTDFYNLDLQVYRTGCASRVALRLQ